MDPLDDYFLEYFSVDEIAGQKVKRQKRYSIIEKDEFGKFTTFFRGVRLKFDSPIDLTGYKFSCILNTDYTEQDAQQDLYKVKVIKNDYFKNIVIKINVLLDDYKINPYSFFDKSLEYSYLYLMKSLRRNVSGNLLYGMEFQYPNLNLVNFIDGSFRGVRLPNKVRYRYQISSQILEFYDESLDISDFLKENNDLDYGTLFGYHIGDNVAVFTSGNTSGNPNYQIDQTDKRILNFGSSYVELINNGLYAPVMLGSPLYSNFNPLFFNGFYPLKNLTWFQVDGGKNFYQKLSSLLSFGSIIEEIQNPNSTLVDFINVENQNYIASNDLTINFFKQNQINLNKQISISESDFNLPEDPAQNLKNISYSLIDIPKKVLYRYNANIFTIFFFPCCQR
jgi:hypothetical protein